MKNSKMLIRHLWNRTDFDEQIISVSDFLKYYHMETYQNIVHRRIADAGLIDMKHVSIAVIKPGDLLLDRIGFDKCEEILSGYVDLEIINIVHEQLDIVHGWVSSYNTMLSSWRRCSLADVVMLFVDCFKDRELADLKGQAVAELLSRTWLNRVRVKVREFMLTLYVKVKYRNVFQWLNQILINQKSDRKN